MHNVTEHSAPGCQRTGDVDQLRRARRVAPLVADIVIYVIHLHTAAPQRRVPVAGIRWCHACLLPMHEVILTSCMYSTLLPLYMSGKTRHA